MTVPPGDDAPAEGRSDAPTRRPWRRLRRLALGAGVAFSAANALVARHAWAFVTYDPDVPPAARTANARALDAAGRARALLLGVSNPRPRLEGDPGQVGLPYVQVALTALDGARLAAWRIPRDGARATVVCVPGYAASRSALLARARAWHDLGAEVVLLDPRGVGEAEGRRTSLGLDEALDVAAAAAWARDARRAGDPGRPVVVDGVSQGGAAALRAARDGGPGARAIDGLLLEAVFDRLTTTVGHRFAAMGLPREPGTTALLAWGSLLLGRDAFAHDPVAYAASVRVPAAVVSGEDDPWVRPDEARALHAGLGGPRHLALAPGVGHASVLDRSPETWRAAARWLLDAVDRSGAR